MKQHEDCSNPAAEPQPVSICGLPHGEYVRVWLKDGKGEIVGTILIKAGLSLAERVGLSTALGMITPDDLARKP